SIETFGLAGDAANGWDHRAIDTVLRGLARIHSVEDHEGRLRSELNLFTRSARDWTRMTALWAALAEHAADRSEPWKDSRVRRAHGRLLEDIGLWSAALD